MKPIFLLLAFAFISLFTTACGEDTAEVETTLEDTGSVNTTTDTVQRQPQDGSSFFAIKEIGLGADGYVSLTNFTDITVTLAGLYLCQGSDCFELPDAEVPPGETVRVAAGAGSELEGVVATEATIGELRSPDGEIALYSSQAYDDPKAMLVYFQWGSTPHDFTQIAIDAGLWVEGGYGPSSQNATRVFRVEESGLWLFEE